MKLFVNLLLVTAFVLFSWHFSSFPVSLEAQVDLSSPRTSEHKKPGRGGMELHLLSTGEWLSMPGWRAHSPQSPDMKHPPDFTQGIFFLVFEVEKIFWICPCWTHCSPFMQIMSASYAKTQCIARYISISIKAKIKSIKAQEESNSMQLNKWYNFFIYMRKGSKYKDKYCFLPLALPLSG